ncbi:hypothetical protein Tco_0077799 [Tanacetum coccineum]
MKEKSTDFVTPIKASGEAQKKEEISTTNLEAAKTLSKVASQSVSKAKSTDKGKRYRRRARSMAKKINTELDAEDEINTGRIEINSGIKDVNTAQMDEEVAKQIHLDKMLAKRVQEEQELSEQQLKRKAKVQKATQFYTEEDWDTIRAKLEANNRSIKSLQEKLKTEFEKLMKSIESFMPMETEARVKRHGLQLEQETSKKQKIDIEDASITKGKDEL